MKITLSERIFKIINACVLFLLVLIAIIPIWHVACSSLSLASELTKNSGLILKPLGFSVEAYKRVMENEMIFIGYKNTVFIVIVGTILNVFITSVAAYALSHHDAIWTKLIMKMIIFTMFFSGGMIPLYLTVRSLNLLNSIWAMIFPVLINTFNLIIMKTSFEALPASLEEAAKIDGANEFVVLFKVVMPLSMPIIATMILYYGVQHWNSWFQAMLFVQNRNLYPLQLILREILIENDNTNMMLNVESMDKEDVAESIKYASIMVATLPILCVYPFLQKYFVKGIMIGAVKG